eukprot:TRINITY_DN2218_c0_g1_i1.p1 TRINITY_DN2218_c0_g1~~TRINITY_DN2218_c0_g1_i1.p1  ORF type:complete len:207 (-),score=57.54 TRINITY_DN2218_c0_g1_i1:47-637(-)
MAKLYYFGIKARGQLPLLVSLYGGVPVQWEKTPDWPSMKSQTPFGQLPVLVDGDVKVAQSMAIARYIAKKANLSGESLADFGMSEQLLEESDDIYGLLVKANSSHNKAEEWKKTFETELPKHWGFLEKLLGDKMQFCSKVLAGDLAIFSIINIVLDLDPHSVDKFPHLKAFYERLYKDAKFTDYFKEPPRLYFKTA